MKALGFPSLVGFLTLSLCPESPRSKLHEIAQTVWKDELSKAGKNALVRACVRACVRVCVCLYVCLFVCLSEKVFDGFNRVLQVSFRESAHDSRVFVAG